MPSVPRQNLHLEVAEVGSRHLSSIREETVSFGAVWYAGVKIVRRTRMSNRNEGYVHSCEQTWAQ
jgi:hypothetical protein